jgi:hypothetical protein
VGTDVSEEHTSSIFSLKGSSMFLRNICRHSKASQLVPPPDLSISKAYKILTDERTKKTFSDSPPSELTLSFRHSLNIILRYPSVLQVADFQMFGKKFFSSLLFTTVPVHTTFQFFTCLTTVKVTTQL